MSKLPSSFSTERFQCICIDMPHWSFSILRVPAWGFCNKDPRTWGHVGWPNFEKCPHVPVTLKPLGGKHGIWRWFRRSCRPATYEGPESLLEIMGCSSHERASAHGLPLVERWQQNRSKINFTIKTDACADASSLHLRP